MKTLFLLSLYLFSFIFQVSAQESTIELKNDFFYIAGEKFFIKGIGYEVGAYPGMLPWERPFNSDVLRSDLQRIADAGFNTIRTWGAFTNQEMQVVQESGLKVIMGVGIDPSGDFSDPAFVNASLQSVQNILNYSKNYDNVIAYLIMNEPMPDHIFDIGYSHLYDLWKQAMQIIHNTHPGRPVSIANTCVGDFIDPQIFDFSAYNIYPYNPATVNHSHLYPAYVNSIFRQRTDGHPLIVTEYGLSVSPSGPGNWGYGGNTIIEQAEGIQYMSRSLIDGSASGFCVFNYSDGWWKAGDEFVHNETAEEWFGLVEYTSLEDIYGSPRIAWDSLKRYNRAVISMPTNEGIYTSQVPVEIFFQDTISRFEILIDNTSVMDEDLSDNYFNSTLSLSPGTIKDYMLKFNFYDESGLLMKTETISILSSVNPVELPAINITVNPEPLQGDQNIQAGFEIVNTGPLETDYILDYAFYNHIGWDYGTALTANLSESNPSQSDVFSYTSEVDVISLTAGINATFGSFKKRITSEKVYLLGDTAHTDPIIFVDPKAEAQERIHISPNPATSYLLIDSNIEPMDLYRIIDASGRIFLEGELHDDQKIDISRLLPGFYIIVITGIKSPLSAAFLKRDQ